MTKILGIVCLFGAWTAEAQTVLASGQAVRFELAPANTFVVVNGARGFRIDVPASAARLDIQVDPATASVPYSVAVRCGTDLAGNYLVSMADAVSSIALDGSRVIFLSQPNDGQAGPCFIGFLQQSSVVSKKNPERRTIEGGLTGRLQAIIHPSLSGTAVTVPAQAVITLAGQPNGVQDSAGGVTPANSPAVASVPLVAGQGLRILASGRSGITGDRQGPEGGSRQWGTPLQFGLSSVACPNGGLVGVFLGPSINAQGAPPSLRFEGGVLDVPVVRPVLQQPFFIGNGMTRSGVAKTFVVPPGATRLFLGVANNPLVSPLNPLTGSLTAFLSTVSVEPEVTGNPVVVPGTAEIYLAGQPNLTNFRATTSQLHAPVLAGIAVRPGATYRIFSNGQIQSVLPGAPFTPAGSGYNRNFEGAFGLSRIAAPNLSLVGVFLGDSVDSSLRLDALPAPIGAIREQQTVRPLLQQVFYIGTGVNTAGEPSTFTAPPGATRLFFGVYGDGQQNSLSGAFHAIVSSQAEGLPQIAAAGIVNGAGFGAAPLTAGSIATIYGSNFGPLTVADRVPLPTTLSGVRVFFNQYPAPLYFVSPNQINTQIPFEVRHQRDVLVTVMRDGAAGLPAEMRLTYFGPGLFAAPEGPVVVNSRTGGVVTAAAPARPGDVLVMYATGLGPTLYDPATGNGASLTQLSPSLLPVVAALLMLEPMVLCGAKAAASWC